MSASWLQLCTAEKSKMVSAISVLSAMEVSKWDRTMYFVQPFAREHITCDKITNFFKEGTGAKQIQFEIPKINDLIDGMYIVSKWPGLPKSTNAGNLACYVWGLGYAFWQSFELKIGNNRMAHVPSDYMEAMSELTSAPGKLLREMVFKWEDVSWHNLQEMSSRPFTLYTPLKLWFTEKAGNALNLGGLSQSSIDATLHVRAMKDFVVNVPFQDSGSMPHIQRDDVYPKDSNGDSLTWASFEENPINLLISVVTLQQSVAQAMANQITHYVVTTFQTTVNPTEEHGVPFPLGSDRVQIINHPFRYPCRSVIWAIADANRTSLVTPAMDAAAMKPYTSGVRALYGARASLAEYNVLDDGCQVPDTFVDGVKFSAGIKKFSAETGRGPWLPKNRYDYRMGDDDGEEIEPLHQMTVKFSGDHRIDETLPGSYFRTVQPFEHWRRIPRMGIYTYSFDDDSASQTTYSSGANFTQLSNAELSFTASRKSTAANPLELHYWIEHWQVYKLQRGTIHVRFNG